MLNVSNHQENANQNHNEISPIRMAIIKKTPQITNIGEDVEKRELLYIVGGNVNWCSHCGKQYEDFSKN